MRVGRFNFLLGWSLLRGFQGHVSFKYIQLSALGTKDLSNYSIPSTNSQFTHIYHKTNQTNVGKYTVRPMDGMGHGYII